MSAPTQATNINPSQSQPEQQKDPKSQVVVSANTQQTQQNISQQPQQKAQDSRDPKPQVVASANTQQTQQNVSQQPQQKAQDIKDPKLQDQTTQNKTQANQNQNVKPSALTGKPEQITSLEQQNESIQKSQAQLHQVSQDQKDQNAKIQLNVASQTKPKQNELDQKTLDELKDAFLQYEQVGKIHKQYLGQAYRSTGIIIYEHDLQQILSEIQDEKVHWNLFTETYKKLKKVEKAEVQKAFDILDQSKTGKIGANNFREILGQGEQALTQQEIEELLRPYVEEDILHYRGMIQRVFP